MPICYLESRHSRFLAQHFPLLSLGGTSQCVLYIKLGTVTVKHTRWWLTWDETCSYLLTLSEIK
jgi:hypothetical protein